MNILVNLILFLLAGAVIWFFAGLVVESVNSVAERFHQSGFTVAFFVLGFLTSISEISVMVNSTLNHTPQVSAGNLVGASFVILLFIVPCLAILGNGVHLKNTLHRSNLAVALGVAVLPVLFLLDGSLSRSEGLACFLVYGTLLYLVRKQHAPSPARMIEEVEEKLVSERGSVSGHIIKIVGGAVCIFLAGHLLVEEAVYFSSKLHIPSSIIGLIFLSIGTNIPELVIAVRSILKKHKEIAFGDYLGSTVANTLIFAFLPWLNGKFTVERTEILFTAPLMVLGFIGFYFAAKSKNIISRQEGWGLVTLYGVFLILQFINFARLAAAA